MLFSLSFNLRSCSVLLVLVTATVIREYLRNLSLSSLLSLCNVVAASGDRSTPPPPSPRAARGDGTSADGGSKSGECYSFRGTERRGAEGTLDVFAD